MAPTKEQLKGFHVGYFPPYEQYYLSNGSECYLNGIGELGSVYYYGTDKEAKDALTKFRRRTKK